MFLMVKPTQNVSENPEKVPSQEEDGGANTWEVGIKQLFPSKT